MPVLAPEHQRGDHVDLLSARGNNPLSQWRVTGPAKNLDRAYDNATRGAVFVCHAPTKLQIPKDSNVSLGLLQSKVVLQMHLSQGQPFSLEIAINDATSVERRLIISSSFNELKPSVHLCRVPLYSGTGMPPKDGWLNLTISVKDLTAHLFQGALFASVKVMTLYTSGRIRHMFATKEDDGFRMTQDSMLGLQPFPSEFHFPPDVSVWSQLLTSKTVALPSQCRTGPGTPSQASQVDAGGRMSIAAGSNGLGRRGNSRAGEGQWAQKVPPSNQLPTSRLNRELNMLNGEADPYRTSNPMPAAGARRQPVAGTPQPQTPSMTAQPAPVSGRRAVSAQLPTRQPELPMDGYAASGVPNTLIDPQAQPTYPKALGRRTQTGPGRVESLLLSPESESLPCSPARHGRRAVGSPMAPTHSENLGSYSPSSMSKPPIRRPSPLKRVGSINSNNKGMKISFPSPQGLPNGRSISPGPQCTDSPRAVGGKFGLASVLQVKAGVDSSSEFHMIGKPGLFSSIMSSSGDSGSLGSIFGGAMNIKTSASTPKAKGRYTAEPAIDLDDSPLSSHGGAPQGSFQRQPSPQKSNRLNGQMGGAPDIRQISPSRDAGKRSANPASRIKKQSASSGGAAQGPSAGRALASPARGNQQAMASPSSQFSSQPRGDHPQAVGRAMESPAVRANARNPASSKQQQQPQRGLPTPTANPAPQQAPVGPSTLGNRAPPRPRVQAAPSGKSVPPGHAPPHKTTAGPGRPIPSAPPQLPTTSGREQARTTLDRSTCSTVVEESLIGLGNFNGFGVEEEATLGSKKVHMKHGYAAYDSIPECIPGLMGASHKSRKGHAVDESIPEMINVHRTSDTRHHPKEHVAPHARGDTASMLGGLHDMWTASSATAVDSPIIRRGPKESLHQPGPSNLAAAPQSHRAGTYDAGCAQEAVKTRPPPVAGTLDYLLDEETLLMGSLGMGSLAPAPKQDGGGVSANGAADPYGNLALSPRVLHSRQRPPVISSKNNHAAGHDPHSEVGQKGAAFPAASRVTQLKGDSEKMVDLVFDPVLKCYYDQSSNQYYELKYGLS